jgi:hypothetical protein
VTALLATLCLTTGMHLAGTLVLARLARQLARENEAHRRRRTGELTADEATRHLVASKLRERAVVEAEKYANAAADLLDTANEVERGGAA